MLLNYIGGAQDTEIRDLSPEQIVAQVHADVSKVLLKPDPPQPRVLGCRVWPRAIPQYNKGHLEIIAALEAACKQEPNRGLFLGGNYRTGVAFGDCVAYGADVASSVETYLSTTSQEGVNSKTETEETMASSSRS